MSFLAFRFHLFRKYQIRETPRIPEWARYRPDPDEGLRGCCRQCVPCVLAHAPQILDYLTLVDGDDLFRLTHGGFIQSALLFENAVCRLPQLFQLCGKRHDDQCRTEEIAAVVLNIDNRSNAALDISAMLAQVCQIH